MEANDELVPLPDSKGFLDLTSRAWVNLDPVIWTMNLTLVTLDISYNHIIEIPPQIGELILLKELKCSFNKVGAIPPEIGKLKRLRRFIFNSNKIKSIPPEIGRLEMLEELVLSENLLEDIPHTVSLMANLRMLKLQNNKLRNIPYELAEVLTLEEIDCSNNNNLDTVPSRWRGDTESLLFTCRVHRDYNIRLEELLTTNADLTKHSQFLEQEQLVMKETIQELKYQIDELKRNLPKKIAKKMAEEAASKNAVVDDTDKKGSFCIVS